MAPQQGREVRCQERGVRFGADRLLVHRSVWSTLGLWLWIYSYVNYSCWS